MTRAESGSRGGLATLDRHGLQHFIRVGRIGGLVTFELYGTIHMASIRHNTEYKRNFRPVAEDVRAVARMLVKSRLGE